MASCMSSWAAMTEDNTLDGLNHKCYSLKSGVWKSEMKVLSGLIYSEACLSWLVNNSLSLWAFLCVSWRERLSRLWWLFLLA